MARRALKEDRERVELELLDVVDAIEVKVDDAEVKDSA